MKSFLNSRLRIFYKLFAFAIISGVAYYFVAYFGLKLAILNNQSSPVWPATGVAIYLFYTLGWPAAVGIFFGAFLANLQTGLSEFPSLLVGLGNMSEAVACICIYDHWIKFKNDYGNHGKIIFAVGAIVLAACCSATLGTTALLWANIINSNLIFKNWSTWWMGDVIGALFFIPFVYVVSVQKLKLFRSIRDDFLKTLFLIFLLCSLNYWIFLSGYGSAYVFAIYLVLLLAAIWLNTLWLHLFSVFTCMVATFATFNGRGPFAEYILNENMLHLQLFLLGLGLTAMVVGALSDGRLQHRPAMALIFGWILSGLIFFSFFNSNKELDQQRFTQIAQETQQSIQMTMNDYFGLLDSGAGFFNASNYVSKRAWKAFCSQLMANKKFAGVKSIGVAYSSISDKREEFIHANHIQPEDIQNFIIHKVNYTNPNTTVEHPELQFIIIYREPEENIDNIIGLNLSTEKFRYEGAMQARSSGLITATNILHLTNEVQARPAFILFAPFYTPGVPLLTVEQRKAAFRGLVYSPIIVEKFINAAMGRKSGELNLTLGFDSDQESSQPVFASGEKPVDYKNKIVSKASFGGRGITFTWRKTENFKSRSNLVFSLMCFFGSLISLLIAIMLSSLQNLTRTAQAIAEKKTKEIFEKNRSWQLLTEMAPVGIFLTDRAGCCTYMNSTFSQISGLSTTESMGVHWTSHVYAEDLALVQEQWSELIELGKFNCNFRFQNKTIIFISAQVVPRLGEHNEIIGYLGVAQDITDSVQKTHSLIASSRLSSLGEMASGVAHEINNPLSIILGKAALINLMVEAENFDRSKLKKFSGQIVETSHRIAKIVRGLRAFARETSDEPFEICKVGQVLQETLEFCRERFYNHEVKLILPVSISEDLKFWGRSEQLAQVLLNLLNNAFDAAIASNDKWVQVSVVSENKKIKILITDSGAGIQSDLMEKIFEPFYTTKDIGKGTGLGLSISKGILEKHQGSLYVDLTAAHTTFVVEISEYVADHKRIMEIT